MLDFGNKAFIAASLLFSKSTKTFSLAHLHRRGVKVTKRFGLTTGSFTILLGMVSFGFLRRTMAVIKLNPFPLGVGGILIAAGVVTIIATVYGFRPHTYKVRYLPIILSFSILANCLLLIATVLRVSEFAKFLFLMPALGLFTAGIGGAASWTVDVLWNIVSKSKA